MLFARLILALNSLGFAVLGLLFLVWPAGMAARIGLIATTPAAIIDVRAIYGGSGLGLAALLGFCAVSIGGAAFGLLAASCVYAGLACGRLIGILAAGGADLLSWALLVLEVIVLAAALAALRHLKGHSRD
jgi:hypothetical protein